MKQKVSNYIADYLADQGIQDIFTVTGGGAMHLNDAFGHHSRLHCTYNHHEQACAMAAEAYARLDNRIAAVCVTSGPGAANAVTGVLGGWMDSIPMLVISGQVRYATTVRSSGLKLRSMGVQEYDITPTVEPMTKYAVMVTAPEKIRYHLEKALYLACHGRPGPVWLDIPLDVQGAIVETESMAAYDPSENPEQLSRPVSDEVVNKILDKIAGAERPVLFPGNGIRLAGAIEQFRELAHVLGVPVVTGMSSIDAIESGDPLYVGRSGGTGDRAGNFAVQNSDLLLSIGSRQSFVQTGFQFESWAREAYTIINDIDEEELKKPNIHVSMPVVADAGELIDRLLGKAKSRGYSEKSTVFCERTDGNCGKTWTEQCRMWKKRYPVVLPEHYKTAEDGCTNIYAFYGELSKVLPENANLVVSVGTSRVAGSQAVDIRPGQRFITNPNTASMGFCLPAAIGVCVASSGKDVICVTGEGSLQMNLQELQTIIQNRFPVKLFVINNQGYHSIRQTQMGYFGEPLVGVGPQSGDLSFPDLEKLSSAYGFPYFQCRESEKLKTVISQVLEHPGAAICQVFVTKYQKTEPKTASRRLEDGSMFSAPLEDMYPFLSREELEENMYIPILKEKQDL